MNRMARSELELLAMGAVVDPFPRCRDPLTRRDHGGVADDRHEIAMPAGLCFSERRTRYRDGLGSDRGVRHPGLQAGAQQPELVGHRHAAGFDHRQRLSGFRAAPGRRRQSLGRDGIAGLAVVSFLIGGAIRYTVIESARAGHTIGSIEGLSHLVLAGAYFIAVAYYLLLLAAFGMKLLGWHDTVLGKIAATVLISGICAVGALKGLGGRRPARDDLPSSREWTTRVRLSFEWCRLRWGQVLVARSAAANDTRGFAFCLRPIRCPDR